MTSDPRSRPTRSAFLEVAPRRGHLAEVEDELFRFAADLRRRPTNCGCALTDPQLPARARKVAVVEDLLGGKALPDQRSAGARSSWSPAAPASSPAIVDRFVELAAAEQRREVAEVRSAIAAQPSRLDRLREALSRATGKNVEVKVVVDPTVLGGIVARVGDLVIDGSVRHRLDQLREQI